jgi:type IV secretory pathway VirD2 relaxase
MTRRRDEDFKAKLGRSRAGKSPPPRFVLRTVRAAAGVAAIQPAASAKRLAHPRWAARGRAVGSVKAGQRFVGQRRVIIKARITRIGRSGIAPLRTHLSYLKRDGVARDGSPDELYDAREEKIDGGAFSARCAEDRHQFRFIVAPEDGQRLDDLKPFVRDLMTDVERDLGTKLDWVAVDHYNTGHPHSHIVVRGKTDRDEDLIIARDYISHGMRARAAELLTLELGPRTDIEQVADWRRQVTQERFTPLDQWIKSRSRDGTIDLSQSGSRAADIFARTRSDLALQRLRQLEVMGLARPQERHSWQLVPDWEQTLRHASTRGDIIKTTHRTLSEQSMSHRAGEVDIASAAPATPITGRLIARGLHDELTDRHFVILDTLDGRIRYQDMSGNRIDPRASPGMSVRLARDRASRQVRLTLLSSWTLDAQVSTNGATWLDRKILDQMQQPSAPAFTDTVHDRHSTTSGFASEVETALLQRKAWLVREGLATEFGDRFVPQTRLLETLTQRDLQSAVQRLASETSMPVSIAENGSELSGTFTRRLDLASGSFAVIDRGPSLAIAPWSPALEAWRGQKVSGVMLGTGIRWQQAKDIGLGIG